MRVGRVAAVPGRGRLVRPEGAPADPGTHGRIVYPLLLLKGSEGKDAARRFYAHLASPAAKAVFERHGFTFLPGS